MSGERSGDGRGHTVTLGQGRTRGGDGGRALTGHLRFRPLVVDGLAGERVHADLGNGHGGVLQLTVEPQHLSPLAGVLHHLQQRQISLSRVHSAAAPLDIPARFTDLLQTDFSTRSSS